MAFTYSKLAETTVGSGGTTSIAFNNIPQNYTDLVIKFSGRNSSGTLYVDDLKVAINSNANTASYTQRNLYGSASTTASSSNTNLGTFAVFGLNGTSTTANTFSNTEIYIPNYASSNAKSISVDAAVENNSGTINLSSLALIAGLFNVTAISQIVLSSYNNYGFAQYSTATLYGIRVEL
jgi:hypothetical protein